MSSCAYCGAELAARSKFCTACGRAIIPGAIRPVPAGVAEPSRWVEPTSLLPLRWGNYIDRYLFGLILIVGGAIQLQGSNTYTLPLLLIGTVAHIVGWSIMPARGWRRLVAVVPSTGTIWLLLTGPQSLWLLALPYLCWLLVRHRPARSYLTVVFPIANGVIIPQFFTEYSGMLPAIAISMAVFVASAWLARLIAASRRIPSQSGVGIR